MRMRYLGGSTRMTVRNVGDARKGTLAPRPSNTVLHWEHHTEVLPPGSFVCSAAAHSGHITWNHAIAPAMPQAAQSALAAKGSPVGALYRAHGQKAPVSYPFSQGIFNPFSSRLSYYDNVTCDCHVTAVTATQTAPVP